MADGWTVRFAGRLIIRTGLWKRNSGIISNDHGDAIRWRPTSWEARGNRTGSVCQNPCVSLRIPVMPAWGGGGRVSWLPGRALTQVMECEARRGGEAVKEQMQQRRAGQGGPGT